MFKILMAILAIIVILVIGTLTYFDWFHSVVVIKKEMPALTFVYKKHQGSFKEVGKVMEELNKELPLLIGINLQRGIGVYLDNPNQKSESELRSLVGFIIEDLDLQKMDQVKMDQLKSKFKVATIPASLSYYSQFPFKGVISYMIAPLKVWPKFATEIAQTSMKPSAGIEIYDTKDKANNEKKIEFYMSTVLGEKLFEDLWRE
ncbi:MAG: GyrI-like domain-containing protein [Oligoflexia bacterium]|nr:GyrI-like domain-containing protein [Oligoflexia bacterium]